MPQLQLIAVSQSRPTVVVKLFGNWSEPCVPFCENTVQHTAAMKTILRKKKKSKSWYWKRIDPRSGLHLQGHYILYAGKVSAEGGLRVVVIWPNLPSRVCCSAAVWMQRGWHKNLDHRKYEGLIPCPSAEVAGSNIADFSFWSMEWKKNPLWWCSKPSYFYVLSFCCRCCHAASTLQLLFCRTVCMESLL